MFFNKPVKCFKYLSKIQNTIIQKINVFNKKSLKKRYKWRIVSFRRAMAPKQSANFAPNGANGTSWVSAAPWRLAMARRKWQRHFDAPTTLVCLSVRPSVRSSVCLSWFCAAINSRTTQPSKKLFSAKM